VFATKPLDLTGASPGPVPARHAIEFQRNVDATCPTHVGRGSKSGVRSTTVNECHVADSRPWHEVLSCRPAGQQASRPVAEWDARERAADELGSYLNQQQVRDRLQELLDEEDTPVVEVAAEPRPAGRPGRAARPRAWRWRGIAKNDQWLHHRLAGLNLRRLLALGLQQQHGAWTLA
jgi:hypothetical protein